MRPDILDQADKVSELIRNGADVNAKLNGGTALHLAAVNGNSRC